MTTVTADTAASFFAQFPELSDETIESAAQSLSAEFEAFDGHLISAPVPVESIAEHFLGYEIEISDEGLFADPDYLGGIVFSENLIQVNASVEANEGRYNFTIAHELGHHVLHREIYLAASSENASNILCRDTFEKPLIEVQADRFAAALLMPVDKMAVAVDATEKPKRLVSPRAVRGYAAAVARTGNFTNVSNTAMVNRLIDLGYLSEAAYQRGTSHDFSRRSRPSIGGAIWRLYNRVRRRLK